MESIICAGDILIKEQMSQLDYDKLWFPYTILRYMTHHLSFEPSQNWKGFPLLSTLRDQVAGVKGELCFKD